MKIPSELNRILSRFEETRPTSMISAICVSSAAWTRRSYEAVFVHLPDGVAPAECGGKEANRLGQVHRFRLLPDLLEVHQVRDGKIVDLLSSKNKLSRWRAR